MEWRTAVVVAIVAIIVIVVLFMLFGRSIEPIFPPIGDQV